ncbi:MAG TPA: phosphatase PAP2 family protein [Bacteroidia bacterium]|nr:phosphatase PAP2 family protein [Bacteroidia bacterium]
MRSGIFIRFVFISLLWSITSASAQVPFKLYNPGDYFAGAGIIGINFGSNALYNHKSPLTDTEIAALSVQNISSFDRSATRFYSRQAARWSDGFLIAGTLLPAGLFIAKEFRDDNGIVAVMALESILLSSAEVQLVKGLVKRPRPFVYNPIAPQSEKRKKDATASFFSGHTALTATASMYTASVYTMTHPDNKRDPWIWTGAVLIPLTTGYLRYKAGKHFPSDILAGFIIGSINGILIPQLHKK